MWLNVLSGVFWDPALIRAKIGVKVIFNSASGGNAVSHSVSGQEVLGSSQQQMNRDGSHKAKTFSLLGTKFLKKKKEKKKTQTLVPLDFGYKTLQMTNEECGTSGASLRDRDEARTAGPNDTKQRRTDCC